MYEHLLYEVHDSGVLWLTLNRPEALNAFNDELSFELQKALKEAEKDKQVRCLVMTGAGKGFCAGQDLKSRSVGATNGQRPHLGESIEKRYAPIIHKLHTMEKPVIAMINGVAAGAGASLAFACDLRVASEKASLIQAFVKVGLIPDSGACWLLPRLAGLGRAMEMMMLGEKIDAPTALQWGLINRVVPETELKATTQVLAEQLAQGPTKALGLMKRAVRLAMGMELERYLGYEASLQEIAGRTDDYQEGVSAFLEKRVAQFSGK